MAVRVGSRLADMFRETVGSSKAMGLFVTAGFPNPDDTVSVLEVLAENGADFIELGMPFSDPIAEGQTIQYSSERALASGVTIGSVLDTARRFRARHNTPLLLMGYVNPIHRYGVESFCREAVEAGVDGLILADVSLESADLLHEPAHLVGLDLVYLVAPSTSDERVIAIDKRATGFVYAVSTSGLTGDSLNDVDRIEDYLARTRKLVTRNPLLVGFGISTHEMAMTLSRHTDGFIVGSALIRQIDSLWSDATLSRIQRLEALAGYVARLKQG